jgi:hypothetical protein
MRNLLPGTPGESLYHFTLRLARMPLRRLAFDIQRIDPHRRETLEQRRILERVQGNALLAAASRTGTSELRVSPDPRERWSWAIFKTVVGGTGA